MVSGGVDLGIRGRPALVAASSRGLGKACATALAEEGARVAICARDRGALDATRDEIAEGTGATVVGVAADVSVEEDSARFVREGSDALGGCEILVANAGGPPTGRFEELSDQDVRDALELNFLSTTRMARETLPLMRRAGYGRVVVISSLAVKQPIPGLILSTSARAAAAGWARTLADEVGRNGITVNTVLPGRFLTDRIRVLDRDRAERSGRSEAEVRSQDEEAIPVGRIGDPRELGDVVAFLCSERASYITGAFLQIDGGMFRGLL
jgi:3-oxoacyl-[acyl-carrier protein] reductase